MTVLTIDLQNKPSILFSIVLLSWIWIPMDFDLKLVEKIVIPKQIMIQIDLWFQKDFEKQTTI